MAADETIRIVLVDDEQMVRQGLRMILESEDGFEVVGEAGDGAAAVAQVKLLDPHVVLMDIQMPGMNGLDATREIVALGRDGSSRVLVLTTFDLDEYVYEALRAGASGFLLKRTPAEDLIAGVRVVAAGEALLSPSITKRLIGEFARRPAADRPSPTALDQLTDRELQAPGEWARELLGEGPAGSRGHAWYDALRRVTRYRLDHAITDTNEPLGPPPADERHARQWQRAHEAIERVERELGREHARDHGTDIDIGL